MSGAPEHSPDEVAELRRLLAEERHQFMTDLEDSVVLVEDTRAELARVRAERDGLAQGRADAREQRDRAQARVRRLLAQRDRLRRRRDALEAELAESMVRDSRAVRLTARLVRRVRRVRR
ncbi:hypothetical protein GCM10011519_10880 [Marmoricola endophyticus]|uniref:Uncharacterized protein n=1 Tax=Marmoricola endophyticus TaxID=2040280 RepID=A0A917BEH7_9ACTN|nr:hypothetical protein [Marmoricola endophyticus]GGF39086.1 hypothetical protein GCM10011519_10880 [Marmoricola endophyticus]